VTGTGHLNSFILQCRVAVLSFSFISLYFLHCPSCLPILASYHPLNTCVKKGFPVTGCRGP
jgi:hypothetical protein